MYKEKERGPEASALFLWYTSKYIHMKLFNKSFYKFLFSFVVVVAATLGLVLLVGIAGQ